MMPQRWILARRFQCLSITKCGERTEAVLPRYSLRTNQFFHRLFSYFCIFTLAAGAAGASTRRTHKHSSQTKNSPRLETISHRSHKPKTKNKKVRGQQAIQGDRAREIQTALIREGYLKGEPTGSWDQETKDAMTRYQADHGWQTKSLPDSRALIQLGLGPDHKTAINAEAAAPAMGAAQVQQIKSSNLQQSQPQ